MTGFAGGRRPRKSDPKYLRPSIYGPIYRFRTPAERKAITDYPIGATVRYTAGREVEPTATGPLTASGVVNGEPMMNDNDEVEYVPVFTFARQNTIMVHVSNIIEVTPWSKTRP